jgi:hypothetical protein
VVVIQKTLQTHAGGGVENAPKVTGSYWIAVVGQSADVDPGDYPVWIAHGNYRAPRLIGDVVRKERLGKAMVQRAEALNAGDVDAEESANRLEGLALAEPRVPVNECLDVARRRSVHSIVAAVPVIIFRQQVVEYAGQTPKVVAREWR